MWMAKVLEIVKHKDNTELLDTTMILFNDDLKNIYKKSLSIVRKKKVDILIAMYEVNDRIIHTQTLSRQSRPVIV